MKDSKFSLQILHHEEVLPTREDAMAQLNDWYKPNSLDAEPVLVKYGDNKNPNIILAFGTSDAKPGSFYAIDMTDVKEELTELKESIYGDNGNIKDLLGKVNEIIKSVGLNIDENKKQDQVTYEPNKKDDVIGEAESVSEALDKLSRFIQKQIKDNNINVTDTKSIDLIYKPDSEDGMNLKAVVKISKSGDSDSLNFNNNIIGVKDDGIYAASHVSYDEERHQLTFSTSGYKDGRFQDDAIIQKINLGKEKEIISHNENKNIKIDVDKTSEENKVILSGEVKLDKYRDNNILKTSDSGLYVEGDAKNIVYNDTTVEKALQELQKKNEDVVKNIEDVTNKTKIDCLESDTAVLESGKTVNGAITLKGNVRLGSNKSIVIGNGGIEANIGVRVIENENKLILSVGNEEKEVRLPGVNILHDIYYDKLNHVFILTWKDGTQQTTIPVKDMLKTWDVENHLTDEIILDLDTKDSNINKLSASLKLRSDDNLIAKNEKGEISVSQNLVQTLIDREVTRENERSVKVEEEIKQKLEKFDDGNALSKKEFNNEISSIKGSINEEISRAKEEENNIKSISEKASEQTKVNTDKIKEMEKNVTSLSNSVTKVEGELNTIESNVDAKLSNLKSQQIDYVNGVKDTLNENIAKEKERAVKVEDGIKDSVEQLSKTVSVNDTQTKSSLEHLKTEVDKNIKQKISEIEENFSDELKTTKTSIKENAVKAETFTTEKVKEEKERAEKIENQLTEKIDTEIERSTKVEKENAKKIDEEKERAVKVEEEIKEILANSIKKVTLEEIADLTYALKVNGVEVSKLILPKDQFFKNGSYNTDTKILTLEFFTNDGDQRTDIDMRDLVDTYFAGNGLELKSNTFKIRLNQESETYLKLNEDGLGIFGINEKFNQKLDKDELNNIVYTKEEIDNKGYLREHQDISELASKESVVETIQKIEELKPELVKVKEEADNLGKVVEEMKFITKDSDTVKINLDKQTDNNVKVFKSEVKIKPSIELSTPNIIKKDVNGLFANVTLTYNESENKLIFNNGYGDKEILLNKYSILQSAKYDEPSESIVFTVKTETGDINNLTIPVNKFLKQKNIMFNQADGNPVFITRNNGESNDKQEVFDVSLSILDDKHNLLKKKNNSLFVDADSNQHYALYGKEEMSVQAVLNILKESIDKNKETVDKISDKVNSVDLEEIKKRVDIIEQKLEKLIDFGQY